MVPVIQHLGGKLQLGTWIDKEKELEITRLLVCTAHNIILHLVLINIKSFLIYMCTWHLLRIYTLTYTLTLAASCKCLVQRAALISYYVAAARAVVRAQLGY